MVEEIAKELCESSTCHHKCPDTDKCIVEDEALLLINENKSNNSDFKSNNFDVKSNEELFKQALVEGLNRRYDKDLQIAEMTETINDLYGADAMYYGVDSYGIATALYNAGYRKQSEGEWKVCGAFDDFLKCSCCGYDYPWQTAIEHKFCPNCGAKMKGGEE